MPIFVTTLLSAVAHSFIEYLSNWFSTKLRLPQKVLRYPITFDTFRKVEANNSNIQKLSQNQKLEHHTQ